MGGKKEAFGKEEGVWGKEVVGRGKKGADWEGEGGGVWE